MSREVTCIICGAEYSPFPLYYGVRALDAKLSPAFLQVYRWGRKMAPFLLQTCAGGSYDKDTRTV